jgi:hypothetical protein
MSLLPEILFAAVRYPDPEVRLQLWRKVREWMDQSGPSVAQEDIVRVLRQCKGTLLEPFHLTEEDLQFAAMLAQTAFSSVCGQTHFRIVGRETIGHSGGCVLARDLEYFYVERFALGKITEISDSVWWFAPSEMPSMNVSAMLPEAFCRLDNDGLTFSMKSIDYNALGWRMPKQKYGYEYGSEELRRDLERHSIIGESPLETFDLRFDINDHEISLFTRTPETLMRLSANLGEDGVIRFDPGPKYPDRRVLFYKPVEWGRSVAVKGCMISPGDCSGPWLHLPAKAIPKVDEDRLRSIVRWYPFPENQEKLVPQLMR